MHQVTLAALRQILLGLGFTTRRVPGARIWFEHADPNTPTSSAPAAWRTSDGWPVASLPT